MIDASHYHEQSSDFHADPIEAAVALARAFSDADVTIYEHPSACCIALGAVATVSITPQGVFLRDPSAALCKGPLGSTEAMLANAHQLLTRVPVDDWRAYGFASFELAHFEADGHAPSTLTNWPFLHLVIPRIEVRFGPDTMLVRALAKDDLEKICTLVARAEPLPNPGAFLDVDVRSHGAADYRRLVARAVDAIRVSALSKVIVSRTIPIDRPIDMYASFVAGRRDNQPARSFLQRRGTQIIAGFSPETVVEVARDGRVTTQPLAGTRARTGDALRDAQRGSELCSDLKEVAEHAMSVKLACEEMARVCSAESVRIDEFMTIAQRGSVQHLASRVGGQLAPSKNAFHALAALFPAITASGIPKQPALRFIREQEPRPRGPYSGAVMIADADGSLDAALVLRSIYQRGAETWLQAGAGVVAQSTPERELEETCEKLLSVSRRLVPVDAARFTFS